MSALVIFGLGLTGELLMAGMRVAYIQVSITKVLKMIWLADAVSKKSHEQL